MGAEIKEVGDEILGAQVKSQVAMMLSYDSRFAFQIQPNNPRFSYPEHFHQIYRAFYQHNLSIDITAPNADLSSYKLIIAPALLAVIWRSLFERHRHLDTDTLLATHIDLLIDAIRAPGGATQVARSAGDAR